MRLARRYLIAGRVQGVGFRWFACDYARLEGLQGWVRNLDDGRVEVQAEGEAEALVRFERAIRRGPAGGRVDSCETTDLPPSGPTGGFSIRP